MSDWRNRIDMIVNKTKAQLHAKGVDNLEQLRPIFAAADKDGSGALNKLEFEELLSNLGVFLARQELRTVHDHFDTNKDGQVGYAEFVGCLKTSMSSERLQIVKHAW
jgi:Ca2+-binding EF-hand superfamily protein